MTSVITNPNSTSCIKKINASLINNNNGFLVNDCNGNSNIDNNSRKELDKMFPQKSIYNFPKLIICDDVKRTSQNSNIYQKYSDIIYDECGNRFNIRNLTNSAGLLQEGYSKNIDLDSHLKNINYYADKCFYDSWKLSPNDDSLDDCHGLKHNVSFLTPNYASIGKNTMGVCTKGFGCSSSYTDNDLNTNFDTHTNTNTPNTTKNTNTTNTTKNTNTTNTTKNTNTNNTNNNYQNEDINCNYDIKKRYDFTKHKMQKESCIKPADWVSFKHAPSPNIDNIKNSSKFPNQKRTLELLNTINPDVQHDYYQFFESNKCVRYPQERLFNNITRRSMLPTHHNLEDMGPKYLKK
jgi:hypothetical protein